MNIPDKTISEPRIDIRLDHAILEHRFQNSIQRIEIDLNSLFHQIFKLVLYFIISNLQKHNFRLQNHFYFIKIIIRTKKIHLINYVPEPSYTTIETKEGRKVLQKIQILCTLLLFTYRDIIIISGIIYPTNNEKGNKMICLIKINR